MRAPATLPLWSQTSDGSTSLDIYENDPAINGRIAVWNGDMKHLDVDALAYVTDAAIQVDESRTHDCTRPEVAVSKNASCRFVLTTVACHNTDTAISSCYTRILRRAAELGCRSLAISFTSHSGRQRKSTDSLALNAVRAHVSAHALPLAVALPPPLPAPPRCRIIRNVMHDYSPADDEVSLCDEEAAAFARAVGCGDTQRLLSSGPRASLRPPLELSRRSDNLDRYERLVRRARSEDLSEVSGIGCLYQSGVDRLGRPVVVFIGKWFPISDIDLDKALLYLIKLLDPIVNGDYVIAYFHTLASATNHPPFSWLKEVYTVLPYKYKKNLKAFYIVHPTFWTKMMTWWFTTFMAPAIKAKVHTLPGVEFLYAAMPRDQLELPAFVTEHDMTINGLHYFQPDANST